MINTWYNTTIWSINISLKENRYNVTTMTDDTCTRASKMMEFHRQHGPWFLSTDSEAWWKISKIPSTKVFRTQTDSSKYCTREFMLPKPNHDSIHATVHNYNFHGSSTLPDSTSPEIRPGLKGSLNSHVSLDTALFKKILKPLVVGYDPEVGNLKKTSTIFWDFPTFEGFFGPKTSQSFNPTKNPAWGELLAFRWHHRRWSGRNHERTKMANRRFQKKGIHVWKTRSTQCLIASNPWISTWHSWSKSGTVVHVTWGTLRKKHETPLIRTFRRSWKNFILYGVDILDSTTWSHWKPAKFLPPLLEQANTSTVSMCWISKCAEGHWGDFSLVTHTTAQQRNSVWNLSVFGWLIVWIRWSDSSCLLVESFVSQVA